jgi:hypothetical protein
MVAIPCQARILPEEPTSFPTRTLGLLVDAGRGMAVVSRLIRLIQMLRERAKPTRRVGTGASAAGGNGFLAEDFTESVLQLRPR